VAQTKISCQLLHVVGLENVSNQPFPFSLEELPLVAGHNASCILAAMLKHG
jgi:hypothetical protein